MTAARFISVLCIVLLSCSSTLVAEQLGPNPCDNLPWQTVDNGMGAEPGVVREFASGVLMPSECLRGGRVWVPRIRLGVTRTASGAPDMEVHVSIRAPQAPGGPPGDLRTDPAAHTLMNVPIFPGGGTYDVSVGPNNNQNTNNILWGDYQYISVDMNGDDTPNQFVVADQMGPIDQDCWTAIEGATPTERCTMGNPSLSRAGIGATGYTFYGRYVTGEEVAGREPLGSTWGARYLNNGTSGGTVNLRVWRKGSPPTESTAGQTICEFLDIPADFEFQCTMSASDLATLAAGGISVELTGAAGDRTTRMIPADAFTFADGFESGDTSVWSRRVP